MYDFHPHPAPAKHSGPLKPRMASERGEYVAIQDHLENQVETHWEKWSADNTGTVDEALWENFKAEVRAIEARRKRKGIVLIEDIKDHDLIPLDTTERRQVQFWTIICVMLAVVIAAAVYVGAAS